MYSARLQKSFVGRGVCPLAECHSSRPTATSMSPHDSITMCEAIGTEKKKAKLYEVNLTDWYKFND